MFSLNTQEKKVLIFIATVALVGIGFNYYQKRIGSLPEVSNVGLTEHSLPLVININTATEEDLVKIPGIGPILAARIIEHRKIQGLFSDIQELKDVKGIGDKKFENLRDFITLDKSIGE